MGGKPRAPKAPPKRIYLAICAHYWGVGDDMLEAEANMVREGGRVGKRGTDSHCYLMPEGAAQAWVDGMSRIWWRYGKEFQRRPDYEAICLNAAELKVY